MFHCIRIAETSVSPGSASDMPTPQQREDEQPLVEQHAPWRWHEGGMRGRGGQLLHNCTVLADKDAVDAEEGRLAKPSCHVVIVPHRWSGPVAGRRRVRKIQDILHLDTLPVANAFSLLGPYVPRKSTVNSTYQSERGVVAGCARSGAGWQQYRQWRPLPLRRTARTGCHCRRHRRQIDWRHCHPPDRPGQCWRGPARLWPGARAASPPFGGRGARARGLMASSESHVQVCSLLFG